MFRDEKYVMDMLMNPNFIMVSVEDISALASARCQGRGETKASKHDTVVRERR
jgi:hypothetical protein